MSSTNRGALRSPADYYATPQWCIEKLRDHLLVTEKDRVLDPASGDGRILGVLAGVQGAINGLPNTWEQFDIMGTPSVDYLTFRPGCRYDLIVTNPPYSLALEFATKALLEADAVCLLLRVNFLGSKLRQPFWRENPPEQLMLLTPRPSFTGGGSDSCEYGWFWWGRTRLLRDHTPFIWFNR